MAIYALDDVNDNDNHGCYDSVDVAVAASGAVMSLFMLLLLLLLQFWQRNIQFLIEYIGVSFSFSLSFYPYTRRSHTKITDLQTMEVHHARFIVTQNGSNK